MGWMLLMISGLSLDFLMMGVDVKVGWIWPTGFEFDTRVIADVRECRQILPLD